ncbi:autotransporter outer membrane beta-barrel domain-containing protein [Agrobacterium sp. Azo12]|nr:autotransporter outer membrane beta-barrel domain-containing protein [Agrobacterium sp. Azo12]MDO5897187.1 autotransporter outer membrane beta-barrel domain-containing protein [Agrobacterium sp. Azo12]
MTSKPCAHAKLDAYTETGGGFPASFNSTSDYSMVVRAGVDGVHAFNDNIRLLARAEAAYRFEDETAATSGTITGLSAFSFDGQETNPFWLRGGLGAEVDVAGGTASLNVNVTTQGDDPTVWVRSGWKVSSDHSIRIIVECEAGQVGRSSAISLAIARNRKNRDVHHPCRVRLTRPALCR